jgi:hypothetical protein
MSVHKLSGQHPVNNLFGLAVISFPLLSHAYFYFVNQLYKIVDSEKPEWLKYKGQPSIFYIGMPRRLDPNVSLGVIGVAFSPRVGQLNDSSAVAYAWAIRLTALLAAAVFAYICWYTA